jgi:hypothetical protein
LHFEVPRRVVFLTSNVKKPGVRHLGLLKLVGKHFEA